MPGNEVWFEDVPSGTVIESQDRDISEDDLINYNKITRSVGATHNDAAEAQKYGFKERLVPGPFILAAALPLHHRTGEHKVLALLGIDGLRFKAPVHPGDRIRLRSEIKSARDSSKPDRGVVVIEEKVLNQRDEVVMEHTRSVLWAKRPC
ncbi:MAG TPA: MaoC/PaaZ C-terminal domain-containing protein [Candidatus Saccharimonadales bacterium]|nr:MaoC/PaaZ C-terminal domain-containing protein [Candidatus Saccharimonadales bacterium]